MLAPGRPADVILFDFDKPHLWPRHNLVSNILHAATSLDISDVMVSGRWLMRRRELLTLDEERIRREAEERAFRMVGSDLEIVKGVSRVKGGSVTGHQVTGIESSGPPAPSVMADS